MSVRERVEALTTEELSKAVGEALYIVSKTSFTSPDAMTVLKKKSILAVQKGVIASIVKKERSANSKRPTITIIDSAIRNTMIRAAKQWKETHDFHEGMSAAHAKSGS